MLRGRKRPYWSPPWMARLQQPPLPIDNNSNRQMAQKFGEWLVAMRYSRRVYQNYVKVAHSFCTFLGKKELQRATHFDVRMFLIEVMKQNLAVEGFNSYLYALRRFFDFLYMGGVVDSVTPRFVLSRPWRKVPPRVLGESQVRELIRCAKSSRDRAMIELLYATGCRVGELVKIRVEDIDFERRTIRVVGKGTGRTVFFNKHAARAVRAYLQRRKTGPLFESAYLQQKGCVGWNGKAWAGHFIDYGGGKARARKAAVYLGTGISEREAWSRFKRRVPESRLYCPFKQIPASTHAVARAIRIAAWRAGVGRVTPHMLRHSYATHLLHRGADIRHIQELLGHASLEATRIYTRVAPSNLAGVYKRCHPRK
jgi:site-specific recombinase XerD